MKLISADNHVNEQRCRDDIRGVLCAGDPVIVRQVTPGAVGIWVREIGLGVLATAPAVGSRLHVELRRGGALASGPVTQLRPAGEGQLAVRTEGRVYVLSDPEHSAVGAQREAELAVAELLPAPSADSCPAESLRRRPLEPEEARRIRVLHVCGERRELFGEGELVGGVEVGEVLRFAAADGELLGISRVQMVRQLSPSCLEISAGDRRYQVEFVSGRLPGPAGR